MVPDEITFLDALPLTPSGKVDRQRLARIMSRTSAQRHQERLATRRARVRSWSPGSSTIARARRGWTSSGSGSSRPAAWRCDASVGHFVSVLSGEVALRGDRTAPCAPADRSPRMPTSRRAGVRGSRLPRVPSCSWCRGGRPRRLGATGSSSATRRSSPAALPGRTTLRWVLTSQYLSRRIFLHHDETLAVEVRRSGVLVSHHDVRRRRPAAQRRRRTRVQDGVQLPHRVQRVLRRSRTCARADGRAPIPGAWARSGDPWLPIDGESTYHLNEAAGGDEEERWVDLATGEERTVPQQARGLHRRAAT